MADSFRDERDEYFEKRSKEINKRIAQLNRRQKKEENEALERELKALEKEKKKLDQERIDREKERRKIKRQIAKVKSQQKKDEEEIQKKLDATLKQRRELNQTYLDSLDATGQIFFRANQAFTEANERFGDLKKSSDYLVNQLEEVLDKAEEGGHTNLLFQLKRQEKIQEMIEKNQKNLSKKEYDFLKKQAKTAEKAIQEKIKYEGGKAKRFVRWTKKKLWENKGDIASLLTGGLTRSPAAMLISKWTFDKWDASKKRQKQEKTILAKDARSFSTKLRKESYGLEGEIEKNTAKYSEEVDELKGKARVAPTTEGKKPEPKKYMSMAEKELREEYEQEEGPLPKKPSAKKVKAAKSEAVIGTLEELQTQTSILRQIEENTKITADGVHFLAKDEKAENRAEREARFDQLEKEREKGFLRRIKGALFGAGAAGLAGAGGLAGGEQGGEGGGGPGGGKSGKGWRWLNWIKRNPVVSALIGYIGLGKAWALAKFFGAKKALAAGAAKAGAALKGGAALVGTGLAKAAPYTAKAAPGAVGGWMLVKDWMDKNMPNAEQQKETQELMTETAALQKDAAEAVYRAQSLYGPSKKLEDRWEGAKNIMKKGAAGATEGLTWGAGIGATLGGIAGTWAFPGVGTAAGIAKGANAGAWVGAFMGAHKRATQALKDEMMGRVEIIKKLEEQRIEEINKLERLINKMETKYGPHGEDWPVGKTWAHGSRQKLARLKKEVEELEMVRKHWTEQQKIQGGAKYMIPDLDPSKEKWVKMAQRLALRHGLDPKAALAQILTESNFNPKAVGAAREIGLGQFLPSTARTLSKRYGLNPRNPRENLEMHIRYMADLVRKYNGDYTKAWKEYNGSFRANIEGTVADRNTDRYVAKVMENMDRIKVDPASVRKSGLTKQLNDENREVVTAQEQAQRMKDMMQFFQMDQSQHNQSYFDQTVVGNAGPNGMQEQLCTDYQSSATFGK
jgi:hypothetical protein